jgi:hypothetical protein
MILVARLPTKEAVVRRALSAGTREPLETIRRRQVSQLLAHWFN